MVPVFKNAEERSTAKNYCPVTFLYAVSKVFQKLVNNRIVITLENVAFFLISRWFYVFTINCRSSHSCI